MKSTKTKKLKSQICNRNRGNHLCFDQHGGFGPSWPSGGAPTVSSPPSPSLCPLSLPPFPLSVWSIRSFLLLQLSKGFYSPPATIVDVFVISLSFLPTPLSLPLSNSPSLLLSLLCWFGSGTE